MYISLGTVSRAEMAGPEEDNRTGGGGGDWAPLVAISAVLGRKWHPVIVHLLLEHGPLGFGNLESDIHDISGKVLSESLTDLVEKGLVERTVVEAKPVRVEYSLTNHGRGLEGAIDELHEWASEYLATEPLPDGAIQ